MTDVFDVECGVRIVIVWMAGALFMSMVGAVRRRE